MTDVVLISTTDHRNAPPGILDRMLASVQEAARARPDLRIRHALLLQNCTPAERDRRLADLPAFVIAESVEGRLSLSAARNKLLMNLAKSDAIGADSIVAFPDDDCWYPPDTLPLIVGLFETDPTLDLWFCRYASRPMPVSAMSAERRARARDVVRSASSNTIFVRGRIARAIGRFDANLGVGTPNLGGEDTDFALKAHALARTSRFCDAALIGHRDPQPALRARYYPGSLLVLGRHAATSFPLMLEYLRKIAIGFVLLLRGELSWRAFIAANRTALQEARGRSENVRSGFPSEHATK